MKLRLVFDDWRNGDGSIYFTPEGIELSLGQFHHGTVFDADLALAPGEDSEMADALAQGYRPVFYAVAAPRVMPNRGSAAPYEEPTGDVPSREACAGIAHHLDKRAAESRCHKDDAGKEWIRMCKEVAAHLRSLHAKEDPHG